jgi:restriction system protein
MQRNPESPWNPTLPVAISPADFELQVQDWLTRSAADLRNIQVKHQAKMSGAGGEYAIDVSVELELFSGARVRVLAECKHQHRPVEREEILALEAKIRDLGAHKGMVFSTSGFQKGALAYAGDRGIATITVLDGRWLYETKSFSPTSEPPSWVKLPRFAGERLIPTANGWTCYRIDDEEVTTVREYLESVS